jgi:hypothetical protein
MGLVLVGDTKRQGSCEQSTFFARTKRHCLETISSISRSPQLCVENFQVLGLLRSWKLAFQDSFSEIRQIELQEKNYSKFLADAGVLCDEILAVYT